MDLQILLRKNAISKARLHASSDLLREVGGCIIGKIVETDKYLLVIVICIVPALKAISRRMSVNFTPNAWSDMWNCIDNHPRYKNEEAWQMVGWYHTHPNFGVFLSNRDLSIHMGHFCNKGHLALVIDPIHNKEGFFCWDSNQEKIVRYPQNKIVIIDDHEMNSWLIKNKISPLEYPLPEPEIRSA